MGAGVNVGVGGKLWNVKRLIRQIVPVKVPQANWPELLGPDFAHWKSTLASLPADAPRVLLAPAVAGPGVTTLDSLLAVALGLRGARADVLLCDEFLPACQNSLLERMPNERELVDHGPQRSLCGPCHRSGYEMLSQLGLRVHKFSDHITDEEIDAAEDLAQKLPVSDIPGFTIDALPIGEHALAGAIRFFARGALDREEHGEAVLRRYLGASIMTMHVMRRLLSRERYACASFHHGIYVPQGIIGAVCREQEVRVVNWAIAYRKNSFIFSHGDTYHHTLMEEPVANWKGLDWTDARDGELVTYLKSRWNGAGDWIHFNRNPQADRDQIQQQIGIDFSAKPTVGLLTNVMWDAQLHYPQNAFANMMDWMLSTIRYFKDRPDLQLLIRVHPAEVSGAIKSRQPVTAEIAREFPTLPPNVFIIPPESSLSTYAAMMECDSVLIYGTKTGVELSSFGVPVIVAGEAWIRNKGLTIDVPSKAEYQRILDRLPLRKRMNPEEAREAKKYAYHFFFRRMIPLRVITAQPPGSWSPYNIGVRSLDELRPGRDPGLDTICDGIIKGTEFIYPAERHAWPGATPKAAS